MTDIAIIQNVKVAGIDTITTLYTSPSTGNGTLITAFTATNDATASVSYKGYIYDSGGAVVGAIIPQTIVVLDKYHSGPSAVNQVVPAGGTIRIENSAASGLNFYATGREQT